MDEKYWILIGSWLLYFIVHSYGASTGVKRFMKGKGLSKTDYRKVYVVFSVAGLIALLLYSSTFSEKYLLTPGRALRYLSLVLAASGTIVIRAAFKQYNLNGFLGLIKENPSAELKVEGILSYVRHPTYSGTILIVLGYLLYSPKLSSLIVTILVIIYLFVGIYFEEKKLLAEFGEAYQDYKRKVPALIPDLRNLISL